MKTKKIAYATSASWGNGLEVVHHDGTTSFISVKRLNPSIFKGLLRAGLNLGLSCIDDPYHRELVGLPND
jgi:hypothetical protein